MVSVLTMTHKTDKDLYKDQTSPPAKDVFWGFMNPYQATGSMPEVTSGFQHEFNSQAEKTRQ